MKRSSSAAERRHLAQVAEMGCIVCSACHGIQDTPAQVHHVHVNFGWGRTSHAATIPLCPEHHDGATGVHTLGADEFTAHHGKSEIELLGIVLLAVTEKRLAA